jgi:putative tryptophan/tyrosine transport system substrate-binding protein
MSPIRLFISALIHKLPGSSLYLRLWVISSLFTLSLSATANNAILVIQDNHNDAASEIALTLSQQLISKSIKIDVLDLSTQTFPENSDLQAYSAIVTIGTHAAEVILNKNPPIRSLSLLVSKQTWTILNQQKNNNQRSAILLDQPVSRQFHLIRELFGIDNDIGLLLGPYSASLETEIIESAKQMQQTVTIKTISNSDELIPALSNLSDSVDLLLAEPDPVVYNKRSIQGILLLTYRSKTPVIGFSQAYSRAGAMVSLYSSTEDIAKQAVEIILDQSTSDRLYDPKYFTISFNQQVARTLGISPPDEKQLIEQINQKEK